MFGWDDAQDNHQQVYGGDGYDAPERKGKFSHELIGGAAAFEAMKVFEDRQRREGKVVEHSFAKEALVGIAGAEVEKLVEVHGMNEYDRYEAKKRAEQNASQLYDQHYIQDQGAQNYDPNQYGPPQRW